MPRVSKTAIVLLMAFHTFAIRTPPLNPCGDKHQQIEQDNDSDNAAENAEYSIHCFLHIDLLFLCSIIVQLVAAA